jgi:predicted MPP superfamily phosphohydrolase
VTLLHIYVFVRVDSLLRCRRWFNRKVLVGTGVVLWLIFFLGRLYGGHEHGFLTVALEVVGMHWMGSLFLIAVGLFFADLACGFGFMFPKTAIGMRTFGLVCGSTLVFIAHVQGIRPPVIETHDVVINGLSPKLDGTNVAVMADLHVGEMMVGSRWLNARIDQVQALRPDFIFLVGDLFERSSDPSELVPVVRRLSAPLGVWAVRGNHDSLRPNRRDVTGEILAGAGIRLLVNEWVRMTDGLVLAGIDDLTSSRRRPGEAEANLDRALSNRPVEPTIFLSHTPWMTQRAAGAGVDMMLSGHTHNGQIWPFNYLIRTRYPFVGGRYDVDGMTLIVCRGTGTWGPRMRLWAPGEISHITLRSPMRSE